MVQLTLPKNSRIVEGKTWPKPAGAKRLASRIYRYDPDAATIRASTPISSILDDCGPMVLDALIWIKNKIDPTLTFRRSCREGICGSCAMNIDGGNTLACTKAMDEIEGRGARSTRCRTCRWSRTSSPTSRNFYAQHASIEPWLQDRRRRRRRRSGCRSPEDRAEARRALRVHPVRLLLDRRARAIGGTASATSARRCCCRPIAG